jgi:hypothetical protein
MQRFVAPPLWFDDRDRQPANPRNQVHSALGPPRIRTYAASVSVWMHEALGTQHAVLAPHSSFARVPAVVPSASEHAVQSEHVPPCSAHDGAGSVPHLPLGCMVAPARQMHEPGPSQTAAAQREWAATPLGVAIFGAQIEVESKRDGVRDRCELARL